MADNSKNKVRNEQKPFLNPYNFIKIPFEKNPHQRNITQNEEKLTGELRCKIKTKTRIFIPESQPEKTEESGHKYYPFMKNQKGECMIPGSSIRGVLRSAYETATDSCFSTLKNTKYLTSRYNGDNKTLTLGILIKEKINDKEIWKLFDANEYLVLANIKNNSYEDEDRWKLGKYKYDRKRKYDYDEKEINTIIGMLKNSNNIWIENKKDKNNREEIETGDCVFFSLYDDKREVRSGIKKEIVATLRKKNEESDRRLRNEKEGYLVIGEQGDRSSQKHYCRVFEKKGNGTEIEKKYIEQVHSLINDYCDPKTNKKLRGEKEGNLHRGYEYLLNKDAIPVIYEKTDEGKYYFQFATMGRRVYGKKLYDFADEIHKPCRKKEELCPACILFGMIGKDDDTNVALGSRIRISDAVESAPLKISDDYNQWDTLSILSNPHIYLPFYQYDIDKEKIKDYKDNLFNENYEGKGISLKGRKFYLHSPDDDKYFKKINPPSGDKTEQNITAQTIGKDAEFVFSIYYENISKKELKTLIRVLTLGENDPNGMLCHKIGHGKSIGMGSSKIIIEDITERTFKDGEYSVESKKDVYLTDLDNNENTLLSNEHYNSLKEICDFKKVTDLYKKGIDIHYPGCKSEKGFEWFGSNASAARQRLDANDDWQLLTDFSEIYGADDDILEKVLFEWQ